MLLICILAGVAYIAIALIFHACGQLSTPDKGQHWLPPLLASAFWIVTIPAVGLYVAYEYFAQAPTKESC